MYSQSAASPGTAPVSDTGGIINHAPPIVPPMTATGDPNIRTGTYRDAEGNLQTYQIMTYVPQHVPLGERVMDSAKEAGERTANCFLGCVCRLCCGIGRNS